MPRSTNNFVGSEIQIISDHEVMGYTRIRGGWNNGRAYTVYFYAVTDHPFVQTATWKGNQISNERYQPDSQQKTGALLRFPSSANTIQLKVGISFISLSKPERMYGTKYLIGHLRTPGKPYWHNGKTYCNALI